MTSEDAHSLFQKPLTRRELLKGAAGVGAALSLGPLLAACGSQSSTGTTASPIGTPTRGGHLRVGMVDFSANTVLDPQMSGLNEDDMALALNSFDCLLTHDPTLKLVPALAEEVTPNNDATEYTARLRPDLTFHNGKAVTADDVIFSFNRILDPKHPKAAAESLAGLVRMKKMDERTVRFYLKSPDAVFPELLAH